jgi:transposase
LRFNAKGPDGLVNGKARGRKADLNEAQRKALAALVDREPQFAVAGTVRWRLCELSRWIAKAFGITASRQTVARELRMMGYRKLSARPGHHAQNREAVDVFKKASLPHWQKSVKARLKAKTQRFGFRMKPVSDRRPNSPADGPGVARGLVQHRINEHAQRIFSALSAPNGAKEQLS